MDSSLFFQFLNVIARNKASSSEELRNAFSLALAAHEVSTATVPIPPVEGPKDVVAVMTAMRNETIKEIEAEKVPVAVHAPVPVAAPAEKKVKLFSAKAPMHIKHYNETIKKHLDMRSNISREKARAVLAAIDGCNYDEVEEKIKEQLGKAV